MAMRAWTDSNSAQVQLAKNKDKVMSKEILNTISTHTRMQEKKRRRIYDNQLSQKAEKTVCNVISKKIFPKIQLFFHVPGRVQRPVWTASDFRECMCHDLELQPSGVSSTACDFASIWSVTRQRIVVLAAAYRV